ncbi:putative OPA3-like protein CG13603 isoform X1 [Aethina tumida]|uniref:putative OPA3-like protein CG13603 isoform X1 n=1 Tax=Aethina tumida TaxID=116153 RepID=UPI00096B4786|nr:putative OPA3-like protein CG13603 isoform X1 [Aethina tumida]
MVVGAFPAAKLGALLLKQISKPIATVVKNQAKQRPFFRKYVCMPPAQFYNWCEVRAKMWMMNLGKPVNIPVLNEAMAIELGSNLLGEGIIFIIAAGIVLYEYNRSANKEEAKESAKRAEIQALNNAIRDLFLQTEEQGAHIRELTRKMGELETKWDNPIKGSKVPKRSPPPPPPAEPTISSEIDDPIYSPELSAEGKVTYAVESTVPESSGFILRTVKQIEHEFWASENKERSVSIVTDGLDHLQSIFRIHIN